jgi:hypothetical protein
MALGRKINFNIIQMNIPFYKLNYKFLHKPLLVGGMAMEYYRLRKSGNDIDLIAGTTDVLNLIKLYPDRVKDLWGDLGVCPYEFEIWKTIDYLDYESQKDGAIEEDDFFVVSLDKLLVMKALAMHKEKYMNDTKLIVKKIADQIAERYTQMNEINKQLMSGIKVDYLEKTGKYPS